MIKLDVIKECKSINVNDKTVNIPKLNLYHRLQFDENKDFEYNLKKLTKTIHPNLSQAERDLVTVHLLQFNGRIKDIVNINDETFKIDDVYISQKLKFTIDDTVFKFKSPNSETDGPINLVLNKCCVSIKKDGIELPIPDFLEMPAFVLQWFDSISNTISLKGSKGTIIKGINKIIEVFE